MDAISKGHVVNFALWSKARKFPTVTETKLHVILQFLQRTQIRMRSKQRNKKKP